MPRFKSRRVHESERLIQLLEAIAISVAKDEDISLEWAEELSDLLSDRVCVPDDSYDAGAVTASLDLDS